MINQRLSKVSASQLLQALGGSDDRFVTAEGGEGQVSFSTVRTLKNALELDDLENHHKSSKHINFREVCRKFALAIGMAPGESAIVINGRVSA